jgi:hypothetical protein
METGYREGNGREEYTGRRLDGQRKEKNFGNRKALKNVTNRMIMKNYMYAETEIASF